MQLIIKNRSSASDYTAWKNSVYAADDAMGNMDEWQKSMIMVQRLERLKFLIRKTKTGLSVHVFDAQ